MNLCYSQRLLIILNRRFEIIELLVVHAEVVIAIIQIYISVFAIFSLYIHRLIQISQCRNQLIEMDICQPYIQRGHT